MSPKFIGIGVLAAGCLTAVVGGYVALREPQIAAPAVPMPEPVPRSPLTGSPDLIEVTMERNSVIGIRLDTALSTRTARTEDRVSATVSREVTVGGRVAIPVGARLEGTVITVDRGGQFREPPRLGLRFDTMILTDGTRMSIQTDTIYREGDSPSAGATATAGTGAVAGTILGGVLGGHDTTLREGAPLTVRLTEDLVVLVQR